MNQPYLHAEAVAVQAPMQAWSALDGQIMGDRAVGASTQAHSTTQAQSCINAQGIYVGDERVLSRVTVEVSGRVLAPTATDEPGGDRHTFHAVLRTPELGVDPAIWLTRERVLTPQSVTERLVWRSSAATRVQFEAVVRVHPDGSTMEQIKQGQINQDPIQQNPAGNGSRNWNADEHGWHWSWRDDHTRAHLVGPFVAEGHDLVARFEVEIEPRGVTEVSWSLTATDDGAPFGPTTAAPLPVPERASDAVSRLLQVSLRDLNGLLLADRDHPEQAFLAAGSPWYFTLFGRDSLISARLLLDHHPALAASTLRVLARRQGSTVDPETAEQPGKIVHEVRRVPLTVGEHPDTAQEVSLPPQYYGTIDATCLWIMLLVDVAARGIDVRDLEPALRRALGWLRDHADSDGDGFLEYADTSGHGLANQGWKDSGDSIRWANGERAAAPIALCEVQGYAHAASIGAAELLADWGDHTQAAQWQEWASALNHRFRKHFWLTDQWGPYPALALDGDKKPVSAVASNMGHLLGTGLLNRDEQRLVVDRLLHPSMASGYGIRTLSTTNGGYWPLGYHVGSVWTHDTATIIDGMLRDGFVDQARHVAAMLLHAAEGFGFRLPELFGGQSCDQVFPPHPYPASCRPQAWAAASAVVMARALRS